MDLDLSGCPCLTDRVIEAADKWDIAGNESLLFGSSGKALGKGAGMKSSVAPDVSSRAQRTEKARNAERIFVDLRSA